MTTGQSLLTLAAFMFLTTILLNFYRIVGSTGDNVVTGQDGILATTIATSYLELAQGLSYDSITDTSDQAILNPAALTSPTALGPETSAEDSIQNFNDFDDFNGLKVERQAGGTNRRFMTVFQVHYVDPTNVQTNSTTRTFLKRMDLKTWRSFPAAKYDGEIDTLRMSLVMGYFHFD